MLFKTCPVRLAYSSFVQVEEQREKYIEAYDVVLEKDETLDVANAILRFILAKTWTLQPMALLMTLLPLVEDKMSFVCVCVCLREMIPQYASLSPSLSLQMYTDAPCF